jgi:hypothetical protein
MITDPVHRFLRKYFRKLSPLGPYLSDGWLYPAGMINIELAAPCWTWSRPSWLCELCVKPFGIQPFGQFPGARRNRVPKPDKKRQNVTKS